MQINMIRVGIGYDVHRLKSGRKLILGGVEIPFEKGLDGHSDADVLMHAICDAVLGSIGLSDIGRLFPNTDPQWKNVPSKIFLQEAARRVNELGGNIINIDSTIIAEAPKISPYVESMKVNIATALGISPQQVGIKATTNEGLGFAGRKEGIAAFVVASIEIKSQK